jgi:hypothetical protein
MTEFEPFPKIARLKRGCVITEKIDGSNAQIMILDLHGPAAFEMDNATATYENWVIFAGSRSRWVKPGKSTDNYGFAGWARDNAAELVKLGPGRHFGEWWGSGINRAYGLIGGDKRFSLFNVQRWADGRAERPACCGVVPTLYEGIFNDTAINNTLAALALNGSMAAPGFMKPEGIVVWHTAARELFKVTLEKDEQPKGLAA